MRYLRLPWPEFGETDTLLNLAMDVLAAMKCPCGCDQWKDQAHDEATQGRWQPRVQKCYAREAITEFQKDHGDQVKDYVMTLELLPEGQIATDPMQPARFDPEVARREYAAQQRRLRPA